MNATLPTTGLPVIDATTVAMRVIDGGLNLARGVVPATGNPLAANALPVFMATSHSDVKQLRSNFAGTKSALGKLVDTMPYYHDSTALPS
ncbi:MAG: hypothetical protein FRX49_11896 [Trebouxia sp. A1-2]|nr:MAG: hypothetical protein FRX49_11896 [Trebouxia sp. A1-2]